MPWGQWARKPSRGAASAIGFDINAGRVRAATGLPGQPCRTFFFGPNFDELPLALNIDGRPMDIGRAALPLRRQSPHQLCANFLPHLGRQRFWTGSKRKIDAKTALTTVADRLRNEIAGAAGFFVSWPAYLDAAQVTLANGLLDAQRMPHLGSVSSPLAIAGATGARGVGLALDADDHAITWSIVAADSKQVRHYGSLPVLSAGIRAWVDRLMSVVADRCIRLCRRDPRDSARAEQALDDQLSAALASPRTDRPWALAIRTEHWFQNMTFSAEEADRGCAALTRAAAEGLRLVLSDWPTNGQPDFLLATSAAARLPGLLNDMVQRLPPKTAVHELPAGGIAEVAQALALRRLRGELCAGHIDGMLPRESAATERITSR